MRLTDKYPQCLNCSYVAKNGQGCKVMFPVPVPCWNHTTGEEAKRREKDIDEYAILKGCGEGSRSKVRA